MQAISLISNSNSRAIALSKRRFSKMILGAALLISSAITAHALILNTGATDENNRRFYFGTTIAHPAFIGAAYDLSGISVRDPALYGVTPQPAVIGTATMISPHYFVTATHFGPQSPGTVLHFVNRDGVTITKTIETGRIMPTSFSTGATSPSDLWVGKLAGVGITPADKIAFYPIAEPIQGDINDTINWYPFNDADMFIYSGISQMAGVNKITRVARYDLQGRPTFGVEFLYDITALQPEEAAVNGDSGSPWGLIINGQFTLGGTHSGFIGTLAANNYTSLSTLLPYYVDKINAYMAEGTTGEQVTIQANRYIVGQKYFAGVTSNILADLVTLPAAEWVDNAEQRSLYMTAGGTSDKEILSEAIDLTTVGTVYFSANVRVRETDAVSNFETTDRFKAELIIDGGPPISLVSAWDLGNGNPSSAPDGYINGYQGTSVADYNANKSRDEFNLTGQNADALLNNVFNLSATIPATANSVRLRISGCGIAQNEFFTVRDVIFSSAAPTTDTDSDGVADVTELVHGTNPNNIASVFKITGMGPAAEDPGRYNVGFTTVNHRNYQAYLSTDLIHWTKDGSYSFRADGRPNRWPLVRLPFQDPESPPESPLPRKFIRIQAGYIDSDFPVTVP